MSANSMRKKMFGAYGSPRSNLTNVEALRAIAALAVVLVHLRVFLQMLRIPNIGGGGVDLFFVISGYLMVYTTRRSTPRPFEFFARRLARIAPMYWLVTCAVYAIALCMPRLLQATRADPVQLFKSLAFIPFKKSNGLAEPVVFVGWTLNYEMFFYALFALGLAVRPYAAGLAATSVTLVALVSIRHLVPQASTIGFFYTSSLILEFAYGMWLALVIPRLPPTASERAKRGVWACVLVGLLLLVTSADAAPQLPRAAWPGIPAALVLGGAVALERWGWRIASPLWLALGEASYSIYLTHPSRRKRFRGRQNRSDRTPL